MSNPTKIRRRHDYSLALSLACDIYALPLLVLGVLGWWLWCLPVPMPVDPVARVIGHGTIQVLTVVVACGIVGTLWSLMTFLWTW